MQFTPCYLRSDKISQKSRLSHLYIIQEQKDRVRMTFSFSLCAAPLLVAYFRSGLEKLSRLGLLESGKVCCCQHWKRVLVLVDF